MENNEQYQKLLERIRQAKQDTPPKSKDKREAPDARFYCHSTGELFTSWSQVAERLELSRATCQKRLSKSPSTKNMKYVIDIENGLYLVNGIKLQRVGEDFVQPEATIEQLKFLSLLLGIKKKALEQNELEIFGEVVHTR